MGVYYICVVGRQTLPIWDKHDLIVDYIDSVNGLAMHKPYDYIFLPTPVYWMADGSFDDQELHQSVHTVQQYGYHHEIILTATLPIGVASRMGCHYLPIQQYALSFWNNNNPTMFGCNEKILADYDTLRNLVSILFQTNNISLYYTDAVEMIFLITLCQQYINHSFYKEMSHFCSKNKVHIHFEPMSWVFYQDMTPILIYMILQMEDAKLDCPILYSCLFRQHYIDISV